MVGISFPKLPANELPLSRQQKWNHSSLNLAVGSSGGLCAATLPSKHHPKPVRPLPKMLIALHGNLSTLSSHLHRQHASIMSFQISRTYNKPSNHIPLLGAAEHRAESSVARHPTNL